MCDDSILDDLDRVLAAKLHEATEKDYRAKRKKQLATAINRLVEQHKAVLKAKAAAPATAAAVVGRLHRHLRS